MTTHTPPASPAPEGAPPARPHRAIRSFVRREGRMTGAQADALARLWPRWGVGPLDPAPGAFAEPAARLDFATLFGRVAPVVVEIGFGDGENLLASAAARPEADFLGIEVHRPGAGRVLHRASALGLANVRVAVHDAVEVLRDAIPPRALASVVLQFPDPWHKTRHHKRRIVQPAFATLVASRLAPGGTFALATDWQPYAEHMLAVLEACPDLANTAGAGHYAPRPDSRPATRFERRGARLGHGVWDLVFAAC